MVAGTITSDSGVIGALSVKSLSIGDNAVTVPVSVSFSGTAPTGFITFAAFTVYVDTTGLAGKDISVWCLAVSHLTALPSGQGIHVSLDVNGGNVQQYAASAAEAILSWKHTFTASGGVDGATFQLYGRVFNNTQGYDGTMFALATKR